VKTPASWLSRASAATDRIFSLTMIDWRWSLDGSLLDAKVAGDLLVQPALQHVTEHFALSRTEGLETHFQSLPLAPLFAGLLGGGSNAFGLRIPQSGSKGTVSPSCVK